MKLRVLGSAAGGGFPSGTATARNARPSGHGAELVPRPVVVRRRRRPGRLAAGSMPPRHPDAAAAQPGAAAGARRTRHRHRRCCCATARSTTAPACTCCASAAEAAAVDDAARLRGPEPGNPILRVLGHYCGVDWHEIGLDGHAFEIPRRRRPEGHRLAAGEQARALFAAPRLPGAGRQHRPHLREHRHRRAGLLRAGPGRDHAAGLGGDEPPDAVLVDGTFWTDDEMIPPGLLDQDRPRASATCPVGRGRHARLARPAAGHARKLLIHINNTNPILDEASPERRPARYRRRRDVRRLEIAF